MSYADFLERKSAGVEKSGREFHPNDVRGKT